MIMVYLDLLDFFVLPSTKYLLSGVAFQPVLDSGMSTAGPPFAGPSMQSGSRFAARGLFLKCKSDPELKGWLLQRFPRPQVQGPSPAGSQALENLSSGLTSTLLYRSRSGFPSALCCYQCGERDTLPPWQCSLHLQTVFFLVRPPRNLCYPGWAWVVLQYLCKCPLFPAWRVRRPRWLFLS